MLPLDKPLEEPEMDATETTAEAERTPEEQRDDAIRATGIDPATGFAHDGQYPLNGRLRAEAMARAGVTNDTEGLVTDDLIAATKDRLDREDAEAERAAKEEARQHPPVSVRMGRDKLVEIAEHEEAAFEADADKPAIVAAIEANRLAGKEA